MSDRHTPHSMHETPSWTPVEKALADIWQVVLGCEDIGVHDDFFRLGGDSILIMQVVAQARKQGIHLRARDLFTHSTISELATAAAGAQAVAVTPADDHDRSPVPLTPNQDWYFAQSPRDHDGFQQSVLVTIGEPVDRTSLRAALLGLVHQHDALRTRFWTGEDGRWIQQPATAAEILSVPLDVVDLSGRGPTAAGSLVAERTAAAERAVRVGQPPLLRAVLFDQGPAGAELLIVAHHLVVDTVSWQILIEDLVDFYDACLDGHPASPVRTSSFASWARRIGERGFQPTPQRDQPGGPTRSVTFRLPADPFERLAADGRASVQEILLAGLAEALPALRGTVGDSIDLERHGRDRDFDEVDVLRTVGWFTHVVALTLPEPGAADPVAEIRKRLTEMPLDTDGRPTNPLTFNYLGKPGSGMESRWPWRPRLGAAPGPATEPLSVVSRIADDELHIDLQYDTSALDVDLIDAFALAYASALEALVGDRDGDEPEEFELTPMQVGMVFPVLRGDGDGSYVEQRIWRLSDSDADRYVHAWQALYRRHDALRMGVRWRARAEPVQFFAPTVTVPVTDVELVDEQAFAEFLRQDRLRGFDLEHPPLARLTKVRVGSEPHTRLVMTDHHILTDGWSYGVLCEELVAILNGDRLPDPAPSFRAYADWLRSQPTGSALDFWRSQLTGLRPLLIAHPEDGSGHREYLVRLDEHTSGVLRQAAPARGLTLSSMAHGCWALALAAFTGQSEVVFATTYAVRPTDVVDVDRIVGPMIGTAPVRVRVSAEQSAQDIMRVFQSLLLEIMEQTPLTLGAVAAAAGLASGTGICDTAMAFENYPIHDRHRGDGEGVNLVSGVVRPALSQPDFPLSVIVRPADGEIGLKFIYDSALVADNTVRILADLVAHQLTQTARSSDQAVGAMSLMAADKQLSAIAAASGSVAQVSADSIVELFEAAVDATPDAVAVAFDAGVLTYADLDRGADLLAAYLRELGAGTETVVGVCLERGPALVTAVLGILKAGAAFLPLDPAIPTTRLTDMAADSGATIVVTMSATGITWPPAIAVVALDHYQDLIEGGVGVRARQRPAADDLAYVIYTSGSTGRPKGVQLQHGGLVNRLMWMARECGLGRGDVVLQKTAFGFDVAVWELLWPLAFGAQLHATAPRTERDALSLTAAIRRSSCTVLHFVPSALDAFLRAGEAVFAGPRLLVCSGEALQPELANAARATFPNARIYNLYGPTEATIDVTFWPVPDPVTTTVPIGRPIANHQALVLDPQGRLVPDGVVGELHLGGVGLARGYAGRPGRTAQSFVPNPFGPPGSRLYQTGDLARRRPSGDIEYVGRTDRQVKIRGFRVECGEVEALVAALEDVGAVVVTAPSDASGVRYLAAYVTPAPGRQVEDLVGSRLRERLGGLVPDHLVPSVFVPVASLPLKPNGKVDLDRLPAPNAPPRRAAPARALTEVESRLAEIWSQVLGHPEVDVDEDFFDLGGHSLAAMRIAGLAGQEFGVDIPVSAAFEARTVASMAESITPRRGAAPPRDRPTPRDHQDLTPTSFAQQSMWLLAQMAPDNPFYNVPASFRLRGRLNTRALSDAVNALVARHEALRTRFVPVDGEPFQAVEPVVGIGFSVEDVIGEDVDAEVERLIVEEARQPFDLSRAPLLRCRLLRLGPEDHVFVLVTHHIVSDAWSKSVVARDLWALYQAADLGVDPELPHLPLRYRDFAIWQREWVDGEPGRQHLEYWTGRMAGAPPELKIPGAREAAQEPERLGATVEFAIGPDVVAGLVSASGSGSVTPFMAVLAAFQGLLSRWTGQEDIVVGTAVAGRPVPELYAVVGMFANTVPIRTDCSGAPTFARLLERVRGTAVEAYSHQQFPFEFLVRALAPTRSAGSDPLVQVLLQEVTPAWGVVAAPPIAGLHVEPLRSAVTTSALDIVVDLRRSGDGGMSFKITYSLDRFEPALADGLAQAWRQMLESVTAGPDRSLAALCDGPLENLASTETTVSVQSRQDPAIGSAGPAGPDTAERIATIWRLLLGVDQVGPEDDFFRLGGHSLLAARLCARIEDEFGVRLRMTAVFAGPRLDQVAAAVDELIRSGSNPGPPPIRRQPRSADQ